MQKGRQMCPKKKIMPVGSDRWEGPKKTNFSELGRLRIVL